MEKKPPLMTSEDVAEYLKLEVTTVRRLVNRGELSAYRLGGEYRFTQDDIDQYLKRQYAPAKGGLLERLGLGRRKQNRFDHLTKRAVRAVDFAYQEARRSQHPYVGIEHLLLGLIHDEEGLAGRVLHELGVSFELTYEVVQSIIPTQGELIGDCWPLHKAFKQVMEQADQEAAALEHAYIGTEHLLLALVKHTDGTFGYVWQRIGVTPRRVNDETLRVLRQAH